MSECFYSDLPQPPSITPTEIDAAPTAAERLKLIEVLTHQENLYHSTDQYYTAILGPIINGCSHEYGIIDNLTWENMHPTSERPTLDFKCIFFSGDGEQLRCIGRADLDAHVIAVKRHDPDNMLTCHRGLHRQKRLYDITLEIQDRHYDHFSDYKYPKDLERFTERNLEVVYGQDCPLSCYDSQTLSGVFHSLGYSTTILQRRCYMPLGFVATDGVPPSKVVKACLETTNVLEIAPLLAK